MGPEQQRWEQRLEKLKADGLVGISHTWSEKVDEMTDEERYAALNALQDAIEQSRTKPLDFNYRYC